MEVIHEEEAERKELERQTGRDSVKGDRVLFGSNLEGKKNAGHLRTL